MSKKSKIKVRILNEQRRRHDGRPPLSLRDTVAASPNGEQSNVHNRATRRASPPPLPDENDLARNLARSRPTQQQRPSRRATFDQQKRASQKMTAPTMGDTPEMVDDGDIMPDPFAGGRYAYLGKGGGEQARNLFKAQLQNQMQRTDQARQAPRENYNFSMRDVNNIYSALRMVKGQLEHGNNDAYREAAQRLRSAFERAGVDHTDLGEGEFHSMDHMIQAFVNSPRLFRIYAETFLEELEEYGNILKTK